jgi:hypothetical protein
MKKVMTSESHPLKVDFVIDLPTRGKLGASASLGPLSLFSFRVRSLTRHDHDDDATGMTFAPGKFQENTPTGNNWHRDVAADVRYLNFAARYQLLAPRTYGGVVDDECLWRAGC